jgi:hypothetical protein
MDSSKLVVKLFVEDSSRVELEAVVPVFHSWIQNHAVEDHLLIDVADYAHVPNGPGVVLVSHEANIYLDQQEGRPGLGYWRKQPIEGTFRDRLRFVFAAALNACARLEEDDRLKGVRFRTDEIVFRINDRLLAPNTPETFATVRSDLETFLTELLAAPVRLEHRSAAKELFEVRIRTGTSAGVKPILGRLVAPAGL